jgi:hypothetical protein
MIKLGIEGGTVITSKYAMSILGGNFDSDAFVIKLKIIPVKTAIKTPPHQQQQQQQQQQ